MLGTGQGHQLLFVCLKNVVVGVIPVSSWLCSAPDVEKLLVILNFLVFLSQALLKYQQRTPVIIYLVTTVCSQQELAALDNVLTLLCEVSCQPA